MALQHLYTKKQLEILKRLKQKDWFILGLHGAKRSGKTVINNDVFLKELIRVKEIAKNQGINEPMYILAGVSSKTIQNNILNELYNKYGISVKLGSACVLMCGKLKCHTNTYTCISDPIIIYT